MDRARLEHLEELAGLRLSEVERKELAVHLAAMARLADSLPPAVAEVPENPTPPAAGRDDTPRCGHDPAAPRVMAAAPELRQGRFLVPGPRLPGDTSKEAP